EGRSVSAKPLIRTISSLRNCPFRTDLPLLAALDARAADDGVPAVVEADPGLPAAVVVRRPHDDRRLLTSDTTTLGAFGLHAAPDSDERVLLPLAPDRRLVGVTREGARLRRKLHQDVH